MCVEDAKLVNDVFPHRERSPFPPARRQLLTCVCIFVMQGQCLITTFKETTVSYAKTHTSTHTKYIPTCMPGTSFACGFSSIAGRDV